jgi:diguanylate cyclase (GGDEF)-like protein/PAS domain S-box-containing protein
MKSVSTTKKLQGNSIASGSSADQQNAAYSWLDDGASLTLLPAPVLHIDHDGKIDGVNNEGIGLARSLGTPETQQCATQLRQLANSAYATDKTEIQTLSWPEKDQTRWLEAMIVPNETRGAFVIGRDSTLEVNMRLALMDSRQRFKDLVEISSDFAWETDMAGSFSFVSPIGALGFPAEKLIGTAARDLLFYSSSPPDNFVFEARDIVEGMELWLKNADGDAVCVLASAKPTCARDGELTGARGICRDITSERLREDDLARLKIREQVIAYIVDAVRNEARPMDMLRTAVTSISGAMTDTACAVFQRESSDCLNLVAYHGSLPANEELSRAVEGVCSDYVVHERSVDGRSVLMIATHYRDNMNGAILLSRDASAAWGAHERSLLEAVAAQLGIAMRQIEDQKELERLSRTDALTGLLNRRAFMDELERAIQRSRRNGFHGAVFFVDLNNFKAVNDTHGHDMGDRVLTRLSDILHGAARSYDFVARLGGDEFALWFENIDKKVARQRANEILRSCQHLEEFSGSPEKKLGLSIGIAIDQPNSLESSDELLKRADAAMYRAKHTQKQSISVSRGKYPDHSQKMT